MDYNGREFDPPEYRLEIIVLNDRPTALVRGLNKYNIVLDRILDASLTQLEMSGVSELVLDLSALSQKGVYFPFLEGKLSVYSFRRRYIGLEPEDAHTSSIEYNRYIKPLIADGLDDALESFDSVESEKSPHSRAKPF